VTPEQIQYLQSIRENYRASGQDLPTFIGDVMSYYRDVLGREVDEATVINFLTGGVLTPPPGATDEQVRNAFIPEEQRRGFFPAREAASVPQGVVTPGAGGGIQDQAVKGLDPNVMPRKEATGTGIDFTRYVDNALQDTQSFLPLTQQQLGREAITAAGTTESGRAALWQGAFGRTFPTGLPQRLSSAADRMRNPIEAQWKLSTALGSEVPFAEFASGARGTDPTKMMQLAQRVAKALPTSMEKTQGAYDSALNPIQGSSWQQRLAREFPGLGSAAQSRLIELSNDPDEQFKLSQQVAMQNVPMHLRTSLGNATNQAYTSFATDMASVGVDPLVEFSKGGYRFLGFVPN